MLRRLLVTGLLVLFVGAAAFWLMTIPDTVSRDLLTDRKPDLANGETMFWAGGCASCHAAPDAEGDERLVMSGGVELETPFGTFVAPNISPHAEAGIGTWSTLDFVNAMVKGTSPDGRHYYPAFPYTYYQRMEIEDIIDLKGFIDTLPSSDKVAAPHSLRFPYSVRRGLGMWKRQYLDGRPLEPVLNASAEVQWGQYLVQGPGHCGACHTPRDEYGGPINSRFLAGTSGDNGVEKAPNITPHEDGIGSWSARDIAYSLETGFDPEFDSFGGSMVEVQENMAKLSPNDRAAIAAYLKTIEPLPSE